MGITDPTWPQPEWVQGEWAQAGTLVGLGPDHQEWQPGGPSGDERIYPSPTVYAEAWDMCGYYHFNTHGSGSGNHHYSVEYTGIHFPSTCDGQMYVYDLMWDGWLSLYVVGLGVSAARADANIEMHNPPLSCLTDVGTNYFAGLYLYDGSDWELWSRGTDHPRIWSRGQLQPYRSGGVPPYQYDRLNPSTADYYSFKAWGRPGDADYDGTQDPQDPDDDNDSLGVGDPLLFRDEVEDFVGTRPLDPCPDDTEDFGAARLYDAWPPDISMDRSVTVVGDVLPYRERIGECSGSANYDPRLDLNIDSCITVVGDVLKITPYMGLSCP